MIQKANCVKGVFFVEVFAGPKELFDNGGTHITTHIQFGYDSGSCFECVDLHLKQLTHVVNTRNPFGVVRLEAGFLVKREHVWKSADIGLQQVAVRHRLARGGRGWSFLQAQLFIQHRDRLRLILE
jgi:hypothetical protein